MILTIKKTIFDSLTDPDQEGVRSAYPSVWLGVPAEYTDADGTHWYVHSHNYPLDLVARIACMAANMQEVAAHDSPYLDNETGEVTDADAFADDIRDLLLNGVTHPLDEGPHEDAQAARDAQEPTEGALDDVFRVYDSVPEGWSRVEPDIA